MSNNFLNLFKTELMNFNQEITNQTQFFEEISDDLFDKGYITKDFKTAIIKRENEYPTGLLLENINLAIPHTDADKVKEAFVYVNRLNNPIEFKQMGNNEESVLVQDVWVLGIKEGGKQVDLLAFIMDIFNNPKFIKKYQKIDSAEDLTNLLEEYSK